MYLGVIMKLKLIIATIILMLGLGFANPVNAKEVYSNAISANPLGLAFGILNATYETQLSVQNSLTISGYYYSWAVDWAAYGIGGSYRWYIVKEQGKRIIEGFSFGPMAAFSFWSWRGTGTADGGSTLSIGIEGAYKWVFGGFVVEPILTISFPVSRFSGAPTYQSYGLGVNLGYAW